MSHCTTCRSFTITQKHADDADCPVRSSQWCSQCSCYGHLPAECDEAAHVWRPRTLEELIPADVRERWGITTQTRIIWPKELTLEDAEREIANTNTIEIRYHETGAPRSELLDSRLREAMRKLKVQTVHKTDGNLLLLRRWAVRQGKKVRLIPEGKP